MEYKAKIFGETRELPARTLAVDEQIEIMRDLDGEYQARKITRREAVEKMHAFVEYLIPGIVPPIDEVDTNELTNACADICAAYAEPVRKAKSDAQMDELRKMLSTPEVQKGLEAVQAMQVGKKEMSPLEP